MARHRLKTWPCYFEPVLSGLKKFEIRNNTDRGFQKGDVVILAEYDPTSYHSTDSSGGYTGRTAMGEITYVTNYAQAPGYVVFGFTLIHTDTSEEK